MGTKSKNLIKKQKVKVYVDGANIFYTQKKLGWILDWKKIKKYIKRNKEVIEWKYYVGVKSEDDKMLSYLRYLDAIKFNVFTKPLKKIKINKKNVIYKANFDVEMATDILLDKSELDEVIIFSGDSDFEYLVRKLKDIGIRAIVYSSRKTISWELKLAVFKYIYLEDKKEFFEREQKDRPDQSRDVL